MATLYVRNFPEELYQAVRELADEKDRSIGSEVIELVGNAVERIQRQRRSMEAMERIAARDKNFKPSIDGKDSLDLLREGRAR
jgi:plasmid stability protein